MKNMGYTYKIKAYFGCIAEGVEVNGVDYYRLSDEKKKYLCSKILNRILETLIEEDVVDFYVANKDNIHCLLDGLIPVDSDSESEPCDQCGDTVRWNIYKI